MGSLPVPLHDLSLEQAGGVLHGGGDVLGLQLRILLEDGLLAVPRRQEVEDEMDGDAGPPDDRLASEDLGIDLNTVDH